MITLLSAPGPWSAYEVTVLAAGGTPQSTRFQVGDELQSVNKTKPPPTLREQEETQEAVNKVKPQKRHLWVQSQDARLCL